MSRPRQSVVHVPIGELTAHPGNVRDTIGDIRELAASIKEHGLLQPLTATEDTSDGPIKYVLLAGHRRLAAAARAGLTRVPVIIRHGLDDPTEHTVVMLVENVQRKDLSTVEKARALGSLRAQGLTGSEISRRTGIGISSVNTLLALLELEDESLEAVETGDVAVGDAIAAVREARATKRAETGKPARGRPVVAEPAHFGRTHPLLPLVMSICDHTIRPNVGESNACGQCWEIVIRADVTGDPLPEPTVDDLVVERVLAGRPNVHATNPERVEVVSRWLAAGKPLAQLRTRTSWLVERYVLPTATGGAA